MQLFDRFYEYNQKYQLIQKEDRILLALSGGKDSVCLLFLLLELQQKFPFTLAAFHLDHMIRGAESKRDADFCAKLCKNMKLDIFLQRADVPAFCKKHKLGLEEGARRERYRILGEIAEANGFSKIATAHTASDQAETVLFRIIRGSGIRGAAGIPLRRGRMIRPLLFFQEREVLQYLRNRHLEFIEDSSNFDINFSRNRIRKKILPEMQKINPAAEDSLFRFSLLCDQQRGLCTALVDDWKSKHGISSDCRCIPICYFKEWLHSDAFRPVLFEILTEMAESGSVSIDFERFERLLSLLNKPDEGKIIEIANSYCFTVANENLVFKKNDSPLLDIQYQIELHEGSNFITPIRQTLTCSSKKHGKVLNINKNLLIICASSDRIEGRLFVRNFRSGDTIRMNGMTKTRI